MAREPKFKETPKLKDVAPKDRPAYIWDYYKLPIIAGGCIIIAIIYTVVHIIRTPDNYIYLMAVNSNFEDETDTDHLFDDYLISREQKPKKSTVFIDHSLQYDVLAEQQSLYDRMAIDTMIGSQTCDVFIATNSTFRMEAEMGVFMPVSDYLTKEQMDKYKDQIIWVTATNGSGEQIAYNGEETANGTEYARGIRIMNNPFMVKSNIYTKDADVAVGIVLNTKYPDRAKDFLLYLLGEID